MLFYSLITLSLNNCGGKVEFDREKGLSKQDIRDLLTDSKIKKDTKFKFTPPLPKSYKTLITPPEPEIGEGKLISFSITEDVNLQDVLIELGRIIDVDIDIDPRIRGGIIMNAKNRPVEEILDRIASLSNTRYKYTNNVLYFERDLPYEKDYLVNYLSNTELWGNVETNINKIVSDTAPNNSSPGSLSSNKSAGIMTIYASTNQHKRISNYLKNVKRKASSQVLIEAKVVEVTLNDNYHTGINWGTGKSSRGGRLTSSAGFEETDPISFVISAGNTLAADLDLSVSALEEFGVTKAISSPRLNALNHQEATLKFIDKLVYFDLTATQDTTTTDGVSTSVVNITADKVEEDTGIELKITPDINLKDGEISLSITQILSVKSGEVDDPTVIPGTDPPQKLGNTVPIIQTREIETTMKLKSGSALVIGGLMKETINNKDTSVPLLSRIPLIKLFFTDYTREKQVVETVIFIKATIINNGYVDKLDREFHDSFTGNPRPYF